MDRWDCKISRLSPRSDAEVKFASKFPLFYAVVAVSSKEFLVCGGAVGSQIAQLKPTAQAFVVSLG